MNPQLAGLVRHFLTVGAGWLIGRGVLDDATGQQLVGAVMALIGVGWSWLAKKPAEPPPQ